MSHFRPDIPGVTSPERLAALELSGLLDTAPEETFDQFTALARQILDVPTVLISLVDEDRQFFKSQAGLPESWAQSRETPLSHSFCQYVVAKSGPVVIDDATQDPAYKDNIAVSQLGVRAYAGVPLRTSSGQVIGSFCAVDSQSFQWTERDVQILTFFADMVMREVTLRQTAKLFNSSFAAMQTSEARCDALQQMLTHDLQAPITSIQSNLQLLSQSPNLDESSQEALRFSLRDIKSILAMIDTVSRTNRDDGTKPDS